MCNSCRNLQQPNHHLNDDLTNSVMDEQQEKPNSASSGQQVFPAVVEEGIPSSNTSSPNDQQNQITASEPIVTNPPVPSSADSSRRSDGDDDTDDEPHDRYDEDNTAEVLPTITSTLEEEQPAATPTISSNNNGEPPELALLACQFFKFQCSCSTTNGGADEDRGVEAAIKGLPEFSKYTNMDINYQGESIHGMINEEETHLSPIRGAYNADELSSFRNRRGKVFYVTDLSLERNSVDVYVVIAWKVNVKDTFGILHALSFDDYVFCLEKR